MGNSNHWTFISVISQAENSDYTINTPTKHMNTLQVNIKLPKCWLLIENFQHKIKGFKINIMSVFK